MQSWTGCLTRIWKQPIASFRKWKFNMLSNRSAQPPSKHGLAVT